MLMVKYGIEFICKGTFNHSICEFLTCCQNIGFLIFFFFLKEGGGGILEFFREKYYNITPKLFATSIAVSYFLLLSSVVTRLNLNLKYDFRTYLHAFNSVLVTTENHIQH